MQMDTEQKAAEVVRERGQLRLLTTPSRRPDWELDEQTRQIGRAGIAAVRETLRKTHPPQPFPKAS
jgi:hypothetical protein